MNVAPRALSVLFAVLAGALGSENTAHAQDCAIAVNDQTVTVEYELNGAAVGIPSTLLFRGSHDGTVRAEDFATGGELWTFRAPEAEAATSAGERLTNLAVLRFDANGDGVISQRDGDRVWLYFGLKHAGAAYYALDVTDKTPRVLWRADGSTMSGLGDAWSTPTISRVRVGGARQNGEHFVVIVGGGYPASGSEAAVDDVAGSALFMLDAASGRVLWSANDIAPASFVAPLMSEPFASRVVAIDFDGDQFADRLYAADAGARVWRFDIWNGRQPAELVTGGVFASLGAVEPLPPGSMAPAASTSTEARRFFNAPDIAYIKTRGEAGYYHIAIGSGDAASLGGGASSGDGAGDGDTAIPGASDVQNRFYSLRDYAPFQRISQSEYDTRRTIFDDDLVPAGPATATSAVIPGASGWKLDLPAGERALSESITVNGVVLFTTFKPAGSPTAFCEATGTNRVYAIKVESAKPALDLDGDAQITDTDRSVTLKEETKAVGTPSIELVRPDSAVQTNEGTSPTDTDGGVPADDSAPADDGAPVTGQPVPPNTRCHAGTEVLQQCVEVEPVVRTFWKRTTVN